MGHNSSKLDKLYRSPLTNWVSATTKLSEHNSKSDFHRQSALFALEFKRVYREQTEPVHRQVNDQIYLLCTGIIPWNEHYSHGSVCSWTV